MPLDERVLREAAKEMGKKGGRPRKVKHEEGRYCRCAECRAGRKEAGRKEVEEDRGFDWGA